LSDDPPHNLHATGVVVGDRGIVVTGASGSGKSSVAFELVERARLTGRFGCLIADDQLFVSGHGGRLVMKAPAPIAGLAEIRGFGVAAVDHEPAALVDLVVELVPADEAPRHRRDKTRTLHGAALPCLELPERDSAGAARAVFAWIDGRDASSPR
jgi:serine kinase of HPr protein (carbohydrate metabolism regulator)